MLQYNANERLSLADILAHPWMQEAEPDFADVLVEMRNLEN